MSVASMASQKVLLVHVGAMLADDSALDRSQLREIAYEALDTALARANTAVDWVTVEEQRRAARRNPTVAVNPDRVPVDMLADPAVDRLPPATVIQLRGIAAMTGSRFALIPAAARIARVPAGGVRATYVVVMADTRSAQVMARLRATATGATPREALLAAAAKVVAP